MKQEGKRRMTRKQKIKLIVCFATVFSVPFMVGENAAIMQPLVKDGVVTDASLKTNKSSAYSIKKKESIDILMQSQNEFKAVKKNESYDTTAMVKVPDRLKKDFSIKIDGSYNGKPIKIYATPDERTELNTTYKVPEYIFTNDLSLYNDHFIKVHDEAGHNWYVDINECNWNAVTGSKLRIAGSGDSKIVLAEGERNLTTNLTSRTYVTPEDLRKITAGTELEGCENAIVETEAKYGVNALFILSVAIHESGWGGSYLARTRNNLFGICAYDSDVDAASSFASKADCIDYFGRLIKNEYFSEGRTDVYSINAVYASDGSWGSQVFSTMNKMVNTIAQ